MSDNTTHTPNTQSGETSSASAWESPTIVTPDAPERETFSNRRAFMFAAIGSAVGLGNIWRFPYVAYENGGGAFILPYLVALLTAGIPLLFLDYAIGHRYRGSAPLAFRRISRYFETFGWWQVLINVIISIYYAVIIGWAASYTYFSLSAAWGADPSAFFFSDFLKMADHTDIGLEFVGSVVGPLIGVWVATLLILALGVQNGVARSSSFFMPLLLVMFVVLVGVSLTLPGAAKGLDALFTPDWSKLTEPKVWVAAYGQIFFSLSICFGIMVTYSSYLKKKSDLTGTGMVVGFANSSFELLAGLGVFAALGFMATAAGKEVSEVASNGIGLAFIAFPTIISKAPFGALIGVLFFGSLVFAGLTSRQFHLCRRRADGGGVHPAVRHHHRPAGARHFGQIRQYLRHRRRRRAVCARPAAGQNAAGAAPAHQQRVFVQSRHPVDGVRYRHRRRARLHAVQRHPRAAEKQLQRLSQRISQSVRLGHGRRAAAAGRPAVAAALEARHHADPRR